MCRNRASWARVDFDALPSERRERAYKKEKHPGRYWTLPAQVLDLHRGARRRPPLSDARGLLTNINLDIRTVANSLTSDRDCPATLVERRCSCHATAHGTVMLMPLGTGEATATRKSQRWDLVATGKGGEDYARKHRGCQPRRSEGPTGPGTFSAREAQRNTCVPDRRPLSDRSA